MSGSDAAERRPLSLRLGAVLEWSAVDKAILAAAIFLAFTIHSCLVNLYVLMHPDVAAYVDRAYLPLGIGAQIAFMCGWGVFIAACCFIRRRQPDNQLVVYTLMLLCSAEILQGSYVFGFVTSPFFGVASLASIAIGFIWFERRPTTVMALVIGGGAAVLLLAEALGLIPTAPMFTRIPLEGGELALSYLVTLGGVVLTMVLTLLLWVGFVVSEFHERGVRLAQANDIISRYVASQLAAQIRRGDHDAIDRRERRKLTLFFSDIESFAETADLTEPEDLAAVLNEYLAEMTSVGKRYGATIDKFVGDAIMIFFGAPEATNDRDHALRGVRMALEMQRTMEELQTKWRGRGFERPFRIRIGINTGHANIGNFGSPERLDYTAIGRQVNLAARLQAACEPGNVLISHSTWALIHEEVPCTAKGAIQVKGFHQPIEVYELDRAPSEAAASPE